MILALERYRLGHYQHLYQTLETIRTITAEKSVICQFVLIFNRWIDRIIQYQDLITGTKISFFQFEFIVIREFFPFGKKLKL